MGILKTTCDVAYKICDGIFSGLGLDKPISFLTDLFKTSFTFKGGMFDKNREKGDALARGLHRERMKAAAARQAALDAVLRDLREL